VKVGDVDAGDVVDGDLDHVVETVQSVHGERRGGVGGAGREGRAARRLRRPVHRGLS